ncbi:MAG: hypothetical protein ABI880_04000 [Acidobacteriota bacterium]
MTRARGLALAAIAAATAYVFWPVLGNGFVNWDDLGVLVRNDALRAAPGALLSWAFSTVHMNHYQPLSWLVYAPLVDADASQVHAVSLAVHVLNVALLVWVAALLADRGRDDDRHWWTAMAATALFAVHPLRVEPVAWASALPYLLSYAPLLMSVGCWTLWLRGGRRTLWWAALAAFTVSQLARVTAPFLPVVLYALALAQADSVARPRDRRALLLALVPFALVVAPLALVEFSARNVETLGDIGLAPRLAAAARNPGLYLWRTIAPLNLSPLDVLPREPRPDWGVTTLAVLTIAAAVALTRHFTSRRTVAAVWGSYLLLLVPVLGLTPSGVQITADRYSYGPAMVLTIALAVFLTRAAPGFRRLGLVAAGVAAVFLGQAATAQTAYWHDSVALWSRAVALDANNDVALFNLGQALSAEGRPDAAMLQYERLVALVPDHAPGRRALSVLQANKAQAVADADAQAGRLARAVTGYDRVLALDPLRLRARVNRGMARVSLGDVTGGVPDLEAAVAGGHDDPAVASALAFAWVTLQRSADAIALLTKAQAAHPDDLGLANNLARLLLTAEPPTLRDPTTALSIAAQINQMNGATNPRLLDTLALALTASGHPDSARQALTRAVSLAREAGDAALAAELRQRLDTLPR